MSAITLRSGNFRITKIVKRTKGIVFREFKEGDIIHFESTLRHTTKWSGGGGSYATDVTTVNTTQDISDTRSQSQLLNMLRNFELEEAGAE